MAKKLTLTALKAMTNAELTAEFDKAAEADDDGRAEMILAEINRRGAAKGPERRKGTRQRRTIAKNQSVGYAIRAIAREFNLPEDSVHLVLPWGRKARTDSSIETLRTRWDEA